MTITWQGSRIDTDQCERLARRITYDWRRNWLYTEHMILSPWGHLLYYRVGNWKRGMTGECKGWWYAERHYGASLDGWELLDREAIENMRLIERRF